MTTDPIRIAFEQQHPHLPNARHETSGQYEHQPTEEAWLKWPKPTYFSYDPDDGIRFHDTAKEAKSRAEDALDRAAFSAADSDWHWEDNEHEISWGIVHGQVSYNDRDLTPEEKSDPDYKEFSFIRNPTLDDLPTADQAAARERELVEALERIAAEWHSQYGRFAESMGTDNPRLGFVNAAISHGEAALAKAKEGRLS